MSQHPTQTKASLTRSLGGRWFAIVLCGSLAGVLIWTKLRLATNVPRTAYAVPHAVETPPGPVRTNATEASPAPEHAAAADEPSASGSAPTP